MLFEGFKRYASQKYNICKKNWVKKSPNYILNFKHKWQQVLSAYKCKSLFAFQGLGTLAISERVCIDIQLERFNVNFFEKRTNAIKPTPVHSLAIWIQSMDFYKCFNVVFKLFSNICVKNRSFPSWNVYDKISVSH